MSALAFSAGLLLTVFFMVSSITAQAPDPAQLPPALGTFIFTIGFNLNQTLYPPDSTLAITDQQLFLALTGLYQSSLPVLDIILDTTIPNNTWLTYTEVKDFNRMGVEVMDMLSTRILIPAKIPLSMELAAMEDVVNFLELPGKSLDEQLGKEVQTIVDEILEKLPNRRLQAYKVIGINSTLSDAQSRSNYILLFAGLYALSTKLFHALMTHEIGHGELSHIPKGTVARVFNDMFWSPIAPNMPGLMSQPYIVNSSTAAQTAAAQILPQLVAAALSRRDELEADAFSIKMGVSKLENPCGMVDAIRNFKQDQDTEPFATHPNTKDRLEAALKVAADEGAGSCSGSILLSASKAIIVLIIINSLFF